jgi:hypothetical protein
MYCFLERLILFAARRQAKTVQRRTRDSKKAPRIVNERKERNRHAEMRKGDPSLAGRSAEEEKWGENHIPLLSLPETLTLRRQHRFIAVDRVDTRRSMNGGLSLL